MPSETVQCDSCGKTIPVTKAWVEWIEQDDGRILEPPRVYCEGDDDGDPSRCRRYSKGREGRVYVAYLSDQNPLRRVPRAVQ